jgi:hypothetical protein
MDAKSIFFYPGIVLTLGWTLMNFAKLFGYVNDIKTEFPQCT